MEQKSSATASSTFPFLLKSTLPSTLAFSDEKLESAVIAMHTHYAPSAIQLWEHTCAVEKNWNKTMNKTSISWRSTAAQQQRPSHSRMEVEVHPGDEYLASLEPESLQVLVSVWSSSAKSTWSVYLSVSMSVGSVHNLLISKSSPHTILMIMRAFFHIQTYIKVANVSDSLTVTPNVWQSVMGMQWNVMLYQRHLYITKLVTESTGLSYLQAAVQYWDMEPVPLYLELRKSSPTSRSR